MVKLHDLHLNNTILWTERPSLIVFIVSTVFVWRHGRRRIGSFLTFGKPLHQRCYISRIHWPFDAVSSLCRSLLRRRPFQTPQPESVDSFVVDMDVVDDQGVNDAGLGRRRDELPVVLRTVGDGGGGRTYGHAAAVLEPDGILTGCRQDDDELDGLLDVLDVIENPKRDVDERLCSK